MIIRIKVLLISALLAAISVLTSCSSTDHFITDKKYRKQVQRDFEARELLASHRAYPLFGVLQSIDLTTREREALQFLYAYMPLADLAEYDGAFYLRNIRHSFMVQDSLPWGKTIPEDIFRHYVLPVRVNNESLDSARWVFYPELGPRVKDLTLEQAALEVNRWCHEKVTYKGTDGRTSSPMNTVKNAFGRCGEESVLTVAALRSVGIPARQVYVPRWAHSDDNHAWVEVWVDGEWKYMGACEPEPVLNRGWFTGPSKRAMLVHTRVFGNYQGNEEVITRESDYAIINSTAIYADIARPEITVLGENGIPVSGAKVEFGLYNYAEFYPIATQITDDRGKCSLSIGKGDILLHASDGTSCSWSKLNLRTDTLVTLTLKPCKIPTEVESWHFDIPDEVPAGEEKLPEEVLSAHQRTLAREDSIRNAYVKTFPGKEEMIAFADRINAPADSLAKYLSISQ
ncbi:MAG: transglutaminase-like domain-containing protein, partial [Bacteroidales bacterium]